MAELIEAVVSWQTPLAVLLVFGVAPGLVLRLIVLLYPKDNPRRKELVAERSVVATSSAGASSPSEQPIIWYF